MSGFAIRLVQRPWLRPVLDPREQLLSRLLGVISPFRGGARATALSACVPRRNFQSLPASATLQLITRRRDDHSFSETLQVRFLHAASNPLAAQRIQIITRRSCRPYTTEPQEAANKEPSIDGDAEFAAGKYQEAAANYTAALKEDPSNAAVLTRRGECYYRLGNYDAAEADFSKAAEHHSGAELALMRLGYILTARVSAGELPPEDGLQRAVDAFDRAIATYPDRADSHYGRGLALTLAGEHDDALSDNSRAIELDPEYAPAYYSRAECHILKGSLDDAIKDLTEFLGKCVDYYNRKDPSGAAQPLSVSETMVQRLMSQALLRRGLLYLESKDHHFAGMDFEAIINMGVADERMLTHAYHRLAYCVLQVYDWEKVITLNTEALKRDPKMAEAYRDRALAYDALGMASYASEDRLKYDVLMHERSMQQPAS